MGDHGVPEAYGYGDIGGVHPGVAKAICHDSGWGCGWCGGSSVSAGHEDAPKIAMGLDA